MLKKLTIALLLFSSIIGTTQVEASSNVKIIIKGEKQVYDQSPILKEGRTLVPLRGIFETLGATVTWQSTTNQIIAIKGSKKITLTLGSKIAYINGVKKTLDVSAQAINGRTLVPLRFISESLGEKVNWDSKNSTVYIGNYLTKNDIIAAINSGKAFTGESMGEHPAKIWFTSFDPVSEQFNGKVIWPTLGAEYEIAGVLLDSTIYFSNTKIIKKENAYGTCSYTVSPYNDTKVAGTFTCVGRSGDPGTVWFELK